MALHGIRVEETGAGISVGLWGEFDLCSLRELRAILDRVMTLGEPVAVDLSGVTFFDVQCTRELAVRALIGSHLFSFENPSTSVGASLRTLGVDLETGRGETRGETRPFSSVRNR